MFILGLLIGLLVGLFIGARIRTSSDRKKNHQRTPAGNDSGRGLQQLLPDPVAMQGNVFLGKKVLFAGDLEMIDRSEAIWCVSKLGGVVTTDINSETDILVVGENPEWSMMEQIEGIDRLRETPIVLMEELEFVTTIDEYFDLGNVDLD